MKKKCIILFTLVLSSFFSFGQVNLVPNPSFEERTGCPEGYPDLDGVCNDWMSFRGSPDYFHNCSSMNGYTNNWGHQEPHSGEGYVSLIPYSVSGAQPSLLREHLGIQLLSPLIIDTKYFVSFYISAAWEPIGMTIATNKTGICFTTYSSNDNLSELPLNNHSHVWTEDVISDTINWIKVSGSFIADSAYTYLVIGNFFEDNFIDTINLPNQVGFNQRAMQYIDDVCVSSDSLFTHNWTTLSISKYEENDIQIYPNPSSDYIQIKTKNKIQKIELYNGFGKLIKSEKYINESEYIINLKNIEKGIYFLKINDFELKKIVIN